MPNLRILAAALLLAPVVAMAQGDKADRRGVMSTSQGNATQGVEGKLDIAPNVVRNSKDALDRGKGSPRDQRSLKRNAVDRKVEPGRPGKGGSPNEADNRLRNIVVGGAVHGQGLIDGCPPGLAKKYNGCMPPGQAAMTTWQRAEWYGFSSADRYRYRDGYLVQLGSRGNIISYNPLLGGILRLGNKWPIGQSSDGLSDYHRRFYNLGSDIDYRSYDNTIYRVDRQTSAIRSVAALLSGQDIAVGQPMPRGYDVYNVPEKYRSQYRDGSADAYRYSDGYVYQIDPQTRLVEAAIKLLT